MFILGPYTIHPKHGIVDLSCQPYAEDAERQYGLEKYK